MIRPWSPEELKRIAPLCPDAVAWARHLGTTAQIYDILDTEHRLAMWTATIVHESNQLVARVCRFIDSFGYHTVYGQLKLHLAENPVDVPIQSIKCPEDSRRKLSFSETVANGVSTVNTEANQEESIFIKGSERPAEEGPKAFSFTKLIPTNEGLPSFSNIRLDSLQASLESPALAEDSTQRKAGGGDALEGKPKISRFLSST